MVNVIKILPAFLISLISLRAWSASAPDLQMEKSPVEFYAKAETTFPLFVGAGFGLSISDHFDFNLMYGLTPKPYYDVIGEAAAALGGRSSYKDVIAAAFQNNSMIRAQTNYFFDSPKSGWLLGGDYSYGSSNGTASIDTVLAAATGRDYSNLKLALASFGRSTNIDISTKLMILGIRGGYGWEVAKDCTFRTTVGVAKIISSEVSLKTGLPNFESSAYGKNMISSSENDLQSIINDNGITPTISAEMNYTF